MADRRYRVVVHLDEADARKQEAVLRNINNLLADLGAEQTQVELVAHGPGLDLLINQTELAQAVEELLARGVMMAACHNTLQGRAIPPERLLPGVIVVSSGIGELVRRQQEGWCYVRP